MHLLLLRLIWLRLRLRLGFRLRLRLQLRLLRLRLRLRLRLLLSRLLLSRRRLRRRNDRTLLFVVMRMLPVLRLMIVAVDLLELVLVELLLLLLLAVVARGKAAGSSGGGRVIVVLIHQHGAAVRFNTSRHNFLLVSQQVAPVLRGPLVVRRGKWPVVRSDSELLLLRELPGVRRMAGDGQRGPRIRRHGRPVPGLPLRPPPNRRDRPYLGTATRHKVLPC